MPISAESSDLAVPKDLIISVCKLLKQAGCLRSLANLALSSKAFYHSAAPYLYDTLTISSSSIGLLDTFSFSNDDVNDMLGILRNLSRASLEDIDLISCPAAVRSWLNFRHTKILHLKIIPAGDPLSALSTYDLGSLGESGFVNVVELVLGSKAVKELNNEPSISDLEEKIDNVYTTVTSTPRAMAASAMIESAGRSTQPYRPCTCIN